MNRDLFAAAGGVVEATSDPYFNSTTLLLNGDGTNGAQNNTFIDSSTNNFTITRSGTPTQGSFSPFSQTGWSAYLFSSAYLVKSGADTLPGDFTVEYWMYYTGGATYPTPLSTYPSSNAIFHQISGGGFNFFHPNSVATVYATFTPALNRWYHIATVRSGSTVTAYVDGTALATTQVAGTLDIGTIGIGDYSSGAGNWFGGYISNLRIVKSAVYTGNFTPPTTPLAITQSAGINIAAITNTTCLLTLQDNRFKDNSINNFTITVSGTPKIEAFSPFAPTAAYSTATVGGSIYFNGTTDYLIKSGAADTLSTNFTIECWLYFNSAATSQTPLTTFQASGGGLFWQTGPGTLYFYTPNNIGNYGQFSYFTFIPFQWYHIAVVVTNNTAVAYVNGVALPNNGPASPVVSGTVDISILGIAAYTGSYVGYYPFGGYISNLRIVKSAVYTGNFTPSTTPLTAIANTSLLLKGTNAGIYDATAKNDIITVGNAQVSSTQIKYGTGAMYFDGTGDAIALLASANLAVGTGDFTIEMWVYASLASNSAIVGASWPRLFTLGTAQGTGCIESYFVSGTTAYIQIDAGSITFTPSILFNSFWNHFAITRSGTAVKAFVNGTQVGTTLTNSSNINLAATTQSWLGAASASNGNWNGYIDDLRITKAARYTTTFTPPTKAMIGQ